MGKTTDDTGTGPDTPLLVDLPVQAAWVARALRGDGYRADFTPASLIEVERFMTANSDRGSAVAGSPLAERLGAVLFAVGAYVGETVRRAAGGTWEADDDDPRGEVNVALRLPDGSVVRPVRRVVKRFVNGPEDSLVAYAEGLGLRLPASGPRPRWWSRISRRP
ncbi:hypothetical protein ABZ883_21745 [Streptomyces sp. NPDC046977]|uniref:hypothetical protein n=1 Tax=Streptomyces sp. NPDC046977 TaxID=3154703 RepID=UPI0033F756CE